MIFVTIGTQLPFDRLIRSVDDWATQQKDSVEIFAQVGPTEYRPRAMKYDRFLSPDETEKRIIGSDLIVAHAGMGSVLSALKYRKPIVVMPRRAALGEHRNDHQMATARWLEQETGVAVAWDEENLAVYLDGHAERIQPKAISEYAPETFMRRLREFINAS